MRKILISHRDGDCWEAASRVERRLRHQFGNGAISSVFHIVFGSQYDPGSVRAHVAKGTVLLVVIGPYWMKSPFDGEQPWLEDIQYHVRLEIESALTHGVPIIPVFLDGASLPAADHLPRSMHGLVDRQGFAVRTEPYFGEDMDRLIDAIKAEAKISRGPLREPRTLLQSGGQEPMIALAQTIRSRMIRVTQGPFLYGVDLDRLAITYDYFIGKYPVTNEEYAVFIAKDGYQNEAYWSREGWTWRTSDDIQCPMYWKEPEWNAEWIIR